MPESKPAKKKRIVKVAIIQLDPLPNLQSVEGDGSVEIENWPEDGRDNIIPIGRPVQVSIRLAERLRIAGRIKSYSISTIEL